MKTNTRIDALMNFARQTWWMARRYADGRATYAPGMFNEALDTVRKAGLENLFDSPPDGTPYASDGMYGAWDPDRMTFRGEPTKTQDGSGWHITIAEKERDKAGLARWRSKKTGKLYHVITMAENATNGPQEGERMVVYFDELRVYVREIEEFNQKFEREENTNA